MSTTNLLEAVGLTRDYGDHRAVDNINLKLDKGEVLGLLGPNGAGKSTTMQMLSGNLAPSMGSVSIAGKDLLDNPKAAKQHLGYLPEQPPVYRDMTVNEYLSYSARLHGVDKSSVSKAVGRAKERCSLNEVERRLIGNLSKGFQQRVGIAQAILHSPSVIILDEPTVGLDPIQIHEIRQLIRDLAAEHSVILSTHILPEVQAVCDRVQIINRGQTVFNDSLDGLEKRHAEPVLMLQLASDIDANELSSIDGVFKVESQSNHRWRIVCDDNREDLSPTIAALAVKKKWGLIELSHERASLEQIFMSLIYQETEMGDVA